MRKPQKWRKVNVRYCQINFSFAYRIPSFIFKQFPFSQCKLTRSSSDMQKSRKLSTQWASNLQLWSEVMTTSMVAQQCFFLWNNKFPLLSLPSKTLRLIILKININITRHCSSEKWNRECLNWKLKQASAHTTRRQMGSWNEEWDCDDIDVRRALPRKGRLPFEWEISELQANNFILNNLNAPSTWIWNSPSYTIFVRSSSFAFNFSVSTLVDTLNNTRLLFRLLIWQ